MKYLPDANIFIRAAKGDPAASKFLDKAVKKGKIVISSVVIAEFLVKSDSQEERSFKSLLTAFPIVPVDANVAELAAKYRRESLKTKRVQMLDCFLAAQAKLNNLTLVTHNKSDFPMKDIRIISPK